LITSAFLLRPQIPIKYAAELRDFNAKHSQSHPKMEAHVKVKEKHIGGCLPNLQYSDKNNLIRISFRLSQKSPSPVPYSLQNSQFQRE
jgi:hypothetical protein